MSRCWRVDVTTYLKHLGTNQIALVALFLPPCAEFVGWLGGWVGVAAFGGPVCLVVWALVWLGGGCVPLCVSVCVWPWVKMVLWV